VHLPVHGATLDNHYPGKWLCCSGPIPWLPRSPNLSICDFSLRGFVKDAIYVPQCSNINSPYEHTMLTKVIKLTNLYENSISTAQN